jgi:hypothetical protein
MFFEAVFFLLEFSDRQLKYCLLVGIFSAETACLKFARLAGKWMSAGMLKFIVFIHLIH